MIRYVVCKTRVRLIAPQTIEKQGFAAVRLDILLRLPTLDSLSDTELVNVQKLACLDPNAPAPSIETILHAVIPYVFVDHTHADAVCAVTNSPDGEAFIREIYGDRALVVPYCMPGFVLAKEVSRMRRSCLGREGAARGGAARESGSAACLGSLARIGGDIYSTIYP